jgi:hypothetical protein
VTIADMSVDADDTIRRSDLRRVSARLRSLLARVASGEVTASPGFEQRLFGGVVVLELLASGKSINVRTLVETIA